MEATIVCPKCQGDLHERTLSINVTERDLLLMMLCLQVVDRHHAKGGTLHFDIHNLQDKLSRESGKMGGSENVEDEELSKV